MYINNKNGVKRLAQVNFTTYEVTLSVAKPIMAQQKKIAEQRVYCFDNF